MNIADARVAIAIDRAPWCGFDDVANAVLGSVGWRTGGGGHREGARTGSSRLRGGDDRCVADVCSCGCAVVFCALPVQEVGIYADAAAPEAVRGRWGRGKLVFFWVVDGRVVVECVIRVAGFFVTCEVDADRDDGLEAIGPGHGGDVRAVVFAGRVEN